MYAKGIIEEVVPPVADLVNVSTAGNLDDSQDSWSSLEIDESTPQANHPNGGSKSLLRGKIQAGIQGRVNDFWKEKAGRYIMQGDYIALIMEGGA